ncbi:3-oxoacyl-ACP synthase [Flavobacterium akiainvivens]|uniref:Beta-ketoacyl-[acyl-carrier-protein] synthase III n=1 Tax=Flavobacterium akiainvivens TaxID=1202724 RepID=A0A0M8MJS2_9FLAO|nr:beta-ketoacyl-ACP synthase III [Flavobacterium akiainvivens]KOS07641.1 3-oxoacyl-ACP synthase [Flavobacterium akiainvivens]SFQ23321.1 3-oxoacyl-[acyl-carrier-protein] synthase-3 [Flavobacterium akiainvivens]
MTKVLAAITATGGYVPDTVLDNAALEKMVDTSNEWILTRTGIRERRIASDPNMATSDMASLAIKDLLAQKNINPEEVECIILATSTPDFLLAPAAAIAASKAGLNNAFALDLNAACSGFLYALSTGAMFIESGRYKKVIVAGTDKMSSIVNYSDRNTCVLFGDGAGAVLLEPAKEGYGLQDNIFKTDGSGSEILAVQGGGSKNPATAETVAQNLHYVQQDGRTVFKNAIKGMSSACADILAQNNLTADDIDWVIPHQANMRIIDAVGDQLGIPKEKIKVNIDRYGNTTAATLPLVLWDYKDDFKPGDKILLTAFGAGFTWGASYLIWQ